MSLELVNLYGRQYATNVQLLLQQKGGKFLRAVDTGSYKGDQASPVDQIGSIEANQVTTRFADMPRTDAPTARRWVFPVDYDANQMIDSFDKLRLLSDPQSKYVENARMAMARKQDREIIVAFTGTAKTGINGGTSTSFPAANEVDVATGGSNSRLNVAKIRAVKELMEANHIDFEMEQAFIGITAKDIRGLPWQAYVYGTFGATRLEENKVYAIESYRA